MQREALIIFVRQPVWGKVKTRLAAATGNEAALSIYWKLLQHTHSVTAGLACDKFIFYADSIGDADLWDEGYYKRRQGDGDLGRRMKAAFEQLFKLGYRRVCIIGSDCFELTSTTITTAFDALQKASVVVGPATDGGYYLLGMNGGIHDLFDGIAWSTAQVFPETVKRLQTEGVVYTLLPEHRDVDTIEDVPEEWLLEMGLRRPGGR